MNFIQADLVYPLTSSPIPNGILVLEEDGKILDLLPENSIEPGNVSKLKGALLPGFINAHCHLELSHLKNKIQRNTGLTEFALNVISKRQEDPEKIEHAMKSADEELFSEGVVAVGDISNTTHSFSIKKNSPIYYHTFIELIGFNPSNSEKIIEAGKKIWDELIAFGLNGSLAPHAPYSVSTDLFKKISSHCFQNSKISSVHNQESQEENYFFQNKSGMLTELYKKLNIDISFFVPPGKRSLPYYIPFLNGVEKLILVHNTYSISEDIREAKAIIPELFLCVCIKANQYIENAVPDLSKLSQEKVKLIIGTDSLASNDSLSILSELKSIHKAFPEISLETLFTWACLNGADSLGIKNTFGSFEKGKKPGVLLLSNLEFGFENSKVKRLF